MVGPKRVLPRLAEDRVAARRGRRTSMSSSSVGVVTARGDLRHADHRVAGDQRRELLLAQPLGAGGRSGSTRKRTSELESQTRISTSSATRGPSRTAPRAARAPRASPVGGVLVPARRQPEHRPRVAGAQRADDDVVHGRGVLHDHDVLALRALEAELGDRGGAVVEQPRACSRGRSRPWRRPWRRSSGRRRSRRCG